MLTGQGKHPSMILEADASKDLWICHIHDTGGRCIKRLVDMSHILRYAR
jgi:hypothetical protein